MFNRLPSGIRIAAFAAAVLFGASAHATNITGAGSTFVYPVLSKWSAAYAVKTGNRVNYQSIGSGGGRPVPWISAPPTSWSLEHGQAHARSLDYVPLPGSLVQRIEVYWKTQFAH